MRPGAPTIALLVDYIVGMYQTGLVRAIEHATRQRGVSLLVFVGRSLNSPNPADLAQSHLYDLIGPGNVDGVIVVSGCIVNYCGPEVLAQYCERFNPLPVVSISVELPGIPSLLISNQQGTRAIVEHLVVHHDARRIACIDGPEASSEARERHQGYLDALAKHGIEPDDTLVVQGDFSVASGAACMRRLFARGAVFDAVVAANDYMAIGALDVLQERGLRVPQDVLLTGFDDAPFARFTLPSLTTVRQPLERLGRLAVESLLRVMDGGRAEATIEVDVDVVTRQSCGCGRAPDARISSLAASGHRWQLLEALSRDQAELVRALHASIGVPPDALGGWAHRLVDGLRAELDGSDGKFGTELGLVLKQAEPNPDYIDELFKVVSLLRARVYLLKPACNVALDLEEIWHQAQVAVGNAATNAQGRTKIDLQVLLDTVRGGFERIATALTRPTLLAAVGQTLPDVHVRRAYIGLVDNDPNLLVPFLTVAPGTNSRRPNEAHAATDLAPPGFLPPERHAHVVMPLSFQSDWFGLFLMEYPSHDAVYGLLRDQVSSALKGGVLYRDTINQAALREQMERAQLQQEAAIASRIQLDILPRQREVQGLELSARMLPAADAAGDYYDVIATEQGCWMGIGDVAGHGLLAGLVMLMIQGMVSAMVRKDPDARPSELVTALNAALHENIRERLQRDEHATLTLLKWDRNGKLAFAGAHEDLLVYRARTRACEIIRPPGVWVGVVEDIRELTSDGATVLEGGDILVLYSDGVIEAMNEKKEQFGLDRLSRCVEVHASRPMDALSQSIIDSVLEWQANQLDDITVLVARYQPPSDPG